jgi:hypothetical protein
MNLSRDDIKKYKSSKNEIEKNAIEMQVIDDSFENDALEGWAHPNLKVNSLKSIDEKLYPKKIKLYFYLSVFLLILGFSVFLFNYSTNSNLTTKISKTKIGQTKHKTSIIHPDTIKTFHNLPIKLQIKPKSVRKDFKDKVSFDSIENKSATISHFEPVKLPFKNPEKIEPELKYRTNIGKETYLQNLKVIDYRFYRSRPVESVKNQLSGTPAENERNNSTVREEKSIVEVSYVSFLEKTLKLFNSSEFKDALNRFETILETYPDDVNALFYSSICLYNLNQFELCEKRLKHLENARFTNFDQEQQWYLLLTYKAENKKDAFEKLKLEIIREKGYYSKKAMALEFFIGL